MATTDREIARWRLHSQHLVGPGLGSAADVVAHLLAVQAENAGQAAWAVATRTRRADAADLDRLLAEGRVLRTHVLRPTWHFVAAEDAGWLLELTAPRIRPVFVRQLQDALGTQSAVLDRLSAAVVEALARQPDQTREQLAETVREAGVEPTGQTMMLLLGLLEVDRLVCSGRPVEGTHTYALFADRAPTTRSLERDEALAELALRYFTGHGPATERDLAYWATLTLGDVRRGIEQVRDRLASFERNGVVFWHAPGDAPPVAEPVREGHLLQILDEVYRGYQDSRMLLDSDGVVPGGRESAIGMALVDAQMVAGMKRTLGRRMVFDIEPYAGRLSRAHRDALEEAAARYAEFLGLEHELRVR